ncbi:uncharacterized protein LOC124264268 [Haliotis rubra]|uniref:uncharacterized protein LOC124264268 n=1 Tax=Haliotis rubra TaxID=36100 RepID=UPI001EE5DA0E|nr:uncharacterized protein LOC124264268 [Haliotis rubra]
MENNVKQDMLTLPPQELDVLIGSYILSLEKDNGEPYEPETLTSYHRAIDRHDPDNDDPSNIVQDAEFLASRKVLEAKTKELKQFFRKMTKVSAPERPVEEWADDVKPIFLIQGLLDSFGPGSKDTTNCTYCQEHGETTAAVAWCSVCDDALCEKCTGAHNRIPSFRHHDVTDLSGEVKVKGKRKAMCKEHKQESLEFLCQDCKKAVCQKCCIQYHRKCDAVVTITSQMVTMKTDLTEMKKSLSKKEDETKLRVKEQKLQEQRERDHYSLMKSHIHSACQKVIDRAKKKERKLLNLMKDISQKHIRQLKADIKTGEMSGCEVGDVEAVGDADLKERGRIASVTFRQDTDKLSKALDDLQLGEIEVLYESVLDLKATPVLQDTIDITVAGDKSKPIPIDVTQLVVNDTDTVVVTDWENTSVKSFYVKNKQTQHRNVLRSISSRHKGNSILQDPDFLSTTLTGNILVSDRGTKCVVCLTPEGDLVFSYSPTGDTALESSHGITSTDTGDILVTDYSLHRVIHLTESGQFVRNILTEEGDIDLPVAVCV